MDSVGSAGGALGGELAGRSGGRCAPRAPPPSAELPGLPRACCGGERTNASFPQISWVGGGQNPQ
eukprot:9474075-Pyramimonas_sp.AAC.1